MVPGPEGGLMRVDFVLTLISFLSVLSSSAFAHDIQLFVATDSWDDVINKDGGEKVSFGVQLQGPTPYTRNGGVRFMPASNTKLFTSGLALEKLGVDYRIETRLQWQRSSIPSVITNLTMTGGGDPTWGLEEYGEKTISV